MPTKRNAHPINTVNKYSRLASSPGGQCGRAGGCGVPEFSAANFLGGGHRWGSWVPSGLVPVRSAFQTSSAGAPPPSPSQRRAQATLGRTGLVQASGPGRAQRATGAPKAHPRLFLFSLSDSRRPSCCHWQEGALRPTPLPSSEGLQAWGRAQTAPDSTELPRRGGTETGGREYSKEIELL